MAKDNKSLLETIKVTSSAMGFLALRPRIIKALEGGEKDGGRDRTP